eukprot:CAMPEP_0170593024 /NCGR_PEP_ID=MMETSP0224-20130122/13226_1 /TAXON_ID=285029 /ORGANISM="Togula jolla, Strain CCCM 725" /LENGTH=345 /DNA_ID=CAMNT_0010916947 /DNA_START=67 /DNA_END=1104 /DNA_ORIENTATION=-
MSKRASSSSDASAAKKARIAADKFDIVIEGLKQAELPAAVMKTLCSIVPYCLGVPTEQRHRFQTEAIEKIQEVFAAVAASLEQRVEVAELAKKTAHQESSAHQTELARLSGVVQTRREEAKAQKVALAKVAQEFQASKRSLVNLKEQQERRRAEAEGKRAEVESLIPELDAFHSCTDSALVEAFLGRVSKHMELPEKLRLAIIGAATQPPASRDSSSAAVLQQVHEMLQGRAAELCVVIAGSDPVAQSAEAVEKEHSVLAAEQVKAGRLYTEAADAAAAVQNELETSEQAMAELQRAVKESEEALEEALLNRELFAQGPLEAISSLCACSTSTAQGLPCEVPLMA